MKAADSDCRCRGHNWPRPETGPAGLLVARLNIGDGRVGLIASVFIDLTMAMLSAIEPMCGNSSLTQRAFAVLIEVEHRATQEMTSETRSCR